MNRLNMGRFICVCIMLGLWDVSGETNRLDIIANGDFENGTEGWVLLPGDLTGSVSLESGAQSVLDDGEAGARLVDSGSDGYYPFLKGSFPAQSDGQYVLEFDFRLKSPAGQWAVELRSATNEIAYRFIFSGTDFRVRKTLTQGERVVSSLKEGVWYHARITVDSAQNQCLKGSFVSFDGNDERKWDQILPTPASAAEFSEIVFRDNGKASSGELCVDNVSIAPAAPTAQFVVRSDPWRSELYGRDWSPDPSLSFEKDKMIQDFSYAGYAQGERSIPTLQDAPVYDVTEFGADPAGIRDSTEAIQAAIDAASATGCPAIVYIPEGLFLLKPPVGKNECLLIDSSHLVLRGAGAGKTRLLNTDTEMRVKKIIYVKAPDSAAWKVPNSIEVDLVEDLLGAVFEIPVASVEGFQVGDEIIVRCDPTPQWLEDHKETESWAGYEEKIGSFLYFRKVTAVDAEHNILTINIPTRYILKRSYNARVYKKTGLLSEIGLEDFSIGFVEHPGKDGWGVFDFAAPTGAYTERLIADAGLDPEEAKKRKSAYDVHFSWAISIFGVVDGWVKNVESFQNEQNVTGCHLLSNGLRLKECSNVSLINCSMQKTQYGGGGGNGYMYRLDNCNECLVERCTAGYARHGFDVSGMACAGNVFFKCLDKETGKQTGGPGGDDDKTTARSSDSHMYFSHSNLYDGCIAQNSWFEARDRYYHKLTNPKHNTTAAHTVFWNTTGLSNSYMPYVVWSLQGKYGYVIGTKGPVFRVKTEGNYPERKHITDPVDHIEGVGQGEMLHPASLYEDQLERRLGKFIGCIAGAVDGSTFVEKMEALRPSLAEPDVRRVLEQARCLSVGPVLKRAFSMEQMGGGQGVRTVDTRNKGESLRARFGDEMAQKFSLATSDMACSRLMLDELPLLAAALRLTGEEAIRQHLEEQLREVITWKPFQRPGWTLGARTDPLPETGDGVWLATGTMIQALAVMLEVLPENLVDPQLLAAVRERIAEEVLLTLHDWKNEVPWYVESQKINSNQWVVPASGMVIGAGVLGREDLKEAYDLGVAALTRSLGVAGRDGSLNEGFIYGMSWTSFSLLLTRQFMEEGGDVRFSEKPFFTNFPNWIALSFQPGGNPVNAFDGFSGQRGSVPLWLTDLTRLAAISGSAPLARVVQREAGSFRSGFFGLLAMGVLSSAEGDALPPESGSFERSRMFVWRSSWEDDASGVWVRGGDKKDFHDHYDRGHVNYISRGIPILIEAGTPGYSNPKKKSDYDSAAGHNTFICDGNIFPEKSPARIEVTRTDSTGGMLSVNLSRPYRSINSATRSVEWSADTLRVVDEFTAPEPVVPSWYWHLATAEEPVIEVINETTVQVSIPAGKITFPGWIGPWTDPDFPQPTEVDMLETAEIHVRISSDHPIEVTARFMGDHTLKFRRQSNPHWVLRVSAQGAAAGRVETSFEVISAASRPDELN